MARRRHQEEHENHERWLVSYADFITLLFAFFVVMYSISSINEGKYKILSEMTGVFNQPDRSIKPIPVGEERPRTTESDKSMTQDSGSSDGDASDPLREITRNISDAFGDLIKDEQMTVRGNELWVEIELNSSLLFPSGDAIPANEAFTIIEKVAKILAPTKTRCTWKVSPITCRSARRTILPTGSCLRAASIVRMLSMDGVNPARLAAVGYGEFQPVADNATAEGRGRNRRVVLVISRNLTRRAVSGVGSANAKPDGALQRAGTQPAPSPAASPSAEGASIPRRRPRRRTMILGKAAFLPGG